jgi:hypothetical protein
MLYGKELEYDRVLFDRHAAGDFLFLLDTNKLIYLPYIPKILSLPIKGLPQITIK